MLVFQLHRVLLLLWNEVERPLLISVSLYRWSPTCHTSNCSLLRILTFKDFPHSFDTSDISPKIAGTTSFFMICKASSRLLKTIFPKKDSVLKQAIISKIFWYLLKEPWIQNTTLFTLRELPFGSSVISAPAPKHVLTGRTEEILRTLKNSQFIDVIWANAT